MKTRIIITVLVSSSTLEIIAALNLPYRISSSPHIISTTKKEVILSRRKVLSTAAAASLLVPPSIANAATDDRRKKEDNFKQWTCDELTPDLCDDLEIETGSIMIRSIPVKYWRYKQKKSLGGTNIDDNTSSSQSPPLPIICLHGGPGYTHNYILPLKQLACRGREVIFYDQAGCGESTLRKGKSVSTEKFPHLLDPAYYSEEELPALIQHWKLDKYHVLGHSWGTILAQLFALNAKDTNTGMQSLILSGPISDSQAYIEAQWEEKEGNLASLPPFVQSRIRALEEEGAYESKEYGAINDVLTTFFTARTAPAPDCLTSAVAGLNEEVYVGMQGPSEFSMSGALADFNVTGRLHDEINVPVLLTHGVYDTMRPSIVKTMEKELKYAERVVFPHSGHVSMIDDTEMMNDVVSDFVTRVETKQYKY